MCLFTRKILDESVSDGALDIRKLLGMQPTLYEVERIARLSSAIADIASLVFTKYDEKCHVPLNIILDLPTWHYYQSTEDRLQHRDYKPSEVMEWIEAIMLRSRQLAGILKSAVLHELDICVFQARGVSTVSKSLRDQPCSNQDGSWRQFYSLLPNGDKPQSIKDLSHLFYVFEVVRPALLAGIRSGQPLTPAESAYKDSARSGRRHRCGSKENQMPRPLVISVDDRSERRIYSKAHSIFLKLPKSPNYPADPTLVQVYTTRRVFIDGNRKGERLYWNDPSPVMPVLSEGKAYGDGGDTGYSQYARELQQMDLITKLWGAECAANIQRWSKEVGFMLR
ncbi:hypothetical protein CNMCM5623_003355 [Aspergillus felis]|uniref:Uncharacterized protein n=1 Tax=Aspergillus felis TaxID=1287682 RepID=A0A8H6V1V7_9EURO|nr:hypothetical protein CNMCM5623_003355 [Aspergillus felis]